MKKEKSSYFNAWDREMRIKAYFSAFYLPYCRSAASNALFSLLVPMEMRRQSVQSGVSMSGWTKIRLLTKYS